MFSTGDAVPTFFRRFVVSSWVGSTLSVRSAQLSACVAFSFLFVLLLHARRHATSAGRWNIRRIKGQADLKKLIGSDPFRSFLNQSTPKIILGIVAAASDCSLCFLFLGQIS